MGRKRSHHESTRTKVISARMTEDTYDLITEHAETLGLTRSGYVEHLIENRPIRMVRSRADELTVPVINELKRIGNNLNQMAHARNAEQRVDPAQFRTVLSEIITVICRNHALRSHYTNAFEEVVGSKADPRAADPARRGVPEPIPETGPGHAWAEARDGMTPRAANDPEPLPGPVQSPQDDEPEAARHDPAPSSPWAKLQRCLRLRSARR